jgi:hypothetical protein
MQFTATCSSGVQPWLSAEGTGKGSVWVFETSESKLYYNNLTSTAIVVTITATAPNADTVTTTVTLLPHNGWNSYII